MTIMRSLVYFVAVSADGFIAESDGTFDRFPVEGPHIDALVAEHPETLPGFVRDALGLSGAGRFDTVLEGRATHQVGLGAGVGDAYPHLRHLVFSSTLDRAAVADGIELVRGDALARVRELKAEPGGDLWLCGGGRLASELLPEIDELLLKVNPVLFGTGIPLFARPMDARLHLTDTRPFPNGVIWNTYRLHH
ncbi:dihydrofolate reductase family protein [Herbiconiux sp. KACC 21604]|uniref:dihydrofolate reductase family protein n=1 Tax=unclassified Herbiconiux TaxID=2618217 RepID=UPI0020A23A5D|nr:dihydrofolate reductase family protein [Herbiconiux sp. SALV-R1]WPO87216.1 dihydrofolate reductase family protein [Herbiconiux sp. KACC 21604]